MQGVSSLPTLGILLNVLALVQMHYDRIVVVLLSYSVDLTGSAFLALLQEVSVHVWLICWLLSFLGGCASDANCRGAVAALRQPFSGGESCLTASSCQKRQVTINRRQMQH